MNNSNFLNNAIRLPVLDWKLSFFGGHRQKVTTNWNVPPEKHLAFEMIYILDGIEDILINNDCYSAKSGDIIIIPPGTKHEILPVSSTGLEYFCTHFDIDDASFITNMIRHCDILIESGSLFNSLLVPSIEEWLSIIEKFKDRAYDFNTKMTIQITLSELLIKLNTYAENQVTLEKKSSINAANYAKEIAETIKYLFKKNSLSEDTSTAMKIEEIIESVGISAGYGYQIFKQVYGFSPREYLSKLKLSEAKNLLMKPELSIEEISEKLGYNSMSHFSRQFKRWSGVSPTVYRKTELTL